jgi:hypothetical protein
MDDEKKIESMMRMAVLPILIFVALFQFFACRGLYADGADCLVAILEHHGFVLWDTRRIVSHIITQGPTVLLVKLGVRDMMFLRYFFSGWLLLAPLLVWGAAIWKVRNDILFWPIVLVFCFVYFNIDFFPIGESDICLPLAVFCFVMLIRPLPPGRFQRGVLLAAAALLLFHYPSTLFHGSLLFALVLMKPHDEWQGASRIYKFALAFLFLASVETAVWSIVLPSNIANFEAARSSFYALHVMQFRYALVYAWLGSALFFIRKIWLRYVVVALCLGALTVIIFDPLKLYPFTHYALRAYIAVALSLCGIGLWWFDRRFRGLPPAEKKQCFLAPAGLAMVLLLALSWFDVQMSLDYADYIENFRMTVNNRSGVIPYARSGMPLIAGDARFKWDWTFPLMSLLLRDNSQKAIIQNPVWYHGDKDFHPETDIPNFDEYYR